MNTKAIMYLLFFLGIFTTVFAADISVKLSQTTIGLNESLTVVFSSHHGINEQPDFSPMEADFELLSNSQQHQTSIINGKISQEISWNLVLIPKREGPLIIPSIQFGPYDSEQQVIDVTKPTKVKKDDDLFLEVEVQPSQSVYEQALLLYSLRLYCGVKVAQAALSEPKTNDQDTIIEKLDDKEYELIHQNGKRYLVFERKYAVFPQHEGELVFSPIIFEGQLMTGMRSFFDIQTQFKRLYSDQIKIEVKPIPVPFNKSNWLAASDVILTEEWPTDPNQIILGEPLTWTLTIKARGCLGEQIPEIPLSLPLGLKHYMDKPAISNQTAENGIVGSKQIKIALIASKPGEFILPEINLKWWDLKTEQIRQTQLPARTIQVQAESIAMNDSSEGLPHDISFQRNENQIPSIDSQKLPVWVWSLIGLNALLFIALFSVILKKARATKLKPDSLKQIKSLLKNACQINDAKKAEELLLIWARLTYPHAKLLNLMSIKHLLSYNLQEAVDELYQVLYGKKKNWSGDSLWEAFCTFKPQKNSNKSPAQSKSLRELYPRN